MKKKFKVTFLLDKSNNWFHSHIKKNTFKSIKRFSFKIEENYKKIKKQDIVFILGYGRLLPESFLDKNKLNLVVHESKLPKDKGGAPIHYQVLKNKKKIYISLIKASMKIDSGDIFLIDSFNLKGIELMNELRSKQAQGRIKIIKRFLKKYPNIKSFKQKGKGNFNRMRNASDSEININKSIKSQFNLLRICDNEKYPAFFKYKNCKFILKIFKG
jgi:methionyl-tRNA formyltransferase